MKIKSHLAIWRNWRHAAHSKCATLETLLVQIQLSPPNALCVGGSYIKKTLRFIPSGSGVHPNQKLFGFNSRPAYRRGVGCIVSKVEKDRNKYLRQQIYCSDRFQGWAYLGGCVFKGEGCATFSCSYENVAKLVRLPTFNRKIEGSSPSILTIIRALSSVVRAAGLYPACPPFKSERAQILKAFYLHVVRIG